MKYFALTSILSLILVGCSHHVTLDDGQGGKVDITTKGNNSGVHMEDSKGNKVDISQDGKTSTVETKDGKSEMVSGTSFTEAELGVPFYPGSKEAEGKGFKQTTPQGRSLMCVRMTDDAPSKVGEFYKDKFKVATNMSSSDSGEMVNLVGQLPSGDTITVSGVRGKDDKETTVTIMVVAKQK